MNLKHFILTILLIFCLYTRKIRAYAIKGNEPGDLTPRNLTSRKILQNNISGDGSCYTQPGDLSPKITNVQWLPNWQLKVTVQSPTYNDSKCKFAPSAIGHFTFTPNGGNRYRFSKSANWVNGYNFDNTEGENCNHHLGDNPYDYIVSYDSGSAPPQGTSTNVALSIYYDCITLANNAACASCDVSYWSTYH